MPSKVTNNNNRVMHSKDHNVGIMICKETDAIIIDFFEMVLFRYQKCLEELMKDSEFIFDFGNGLVYKFHTVSKNCAGSCTNSPDCIKNKNATTNPVNKNDDKCFQYATTVALN